MKNILVLFLCLVPCVSLADDRETEVLRRINVVRRSHGLQPVTLEKRLVDAARSQSEWMASVGRMEHLRGEAKSFDEFRTGDFHPTNRVVQSGYFAFEDLYRLESLPNGVVVHPLPEANEKVGEIIARGWGGHDSGSPARVVTGWMNSPGHRHEILKGQYREAGVGITSPRPGEYYWCVVFAYR
jgi:uncharacterized protein YkwD